MLFIYAEKVTSAVVSWVLNFLKRLSPFCSNLVFLAFFVKPILSSCIKWLKLWILQLNSLFFFCIIPSELLSAQWSVYNKHIGVFFLKRSCSKKKKLEKKQNCVNLAMWLLYLQGKCAIYGSQMVPGFSAELQYLIFFTVSFFQSVPQVTKCLLVLRVTRKSQNIH